MYVCLEQNLALIEVAYMIVKILGGFQSIENRDPVLKIVGIFEHITESINGAKVSMATV